MKRATRIGFWVTIIGTLLFGGMVATRPTGGCIPAVGRDHSAHISHISASEIHYTFLERTCYVETTYLLGFVGFALAISGAFLWNSGELSNEQASKNKSRN